MSRISGHFTQNDTQYDYSVGRIKDILGSYENIARACHAATNVSISGNAIRLWFMHRSIPLEYCALFQDLTNGDVEIDDFFPWLNLYL